MIDKRKKIGENAHTHKKVNEKQIQCASLCYTRVFVIKQSYSAYYTDRVNWLVVICVFPLILSLPASD